MFLKPRLLTILLGGVLVLAIGGAVMCSELENSNISLDIKSEQDTILSGAPCLFTLTFSNKSQASMEIDLGSDASEAISFQILDHDGKVLSSGRKIQKMGLSRSGKRTIPSNGTIQEDRVLNRWCSTLLPVGEYKIICHVELGNYPIMKSEYDLRVVPVHKEELEKILSSLFAIVISERPYSEKILANKMLVYTDSPFVVPILSKLIAEVEVDNNFKMEAVDALERMGTVEVAKVLVAFAMNERGDNLDILLTRKIIASVFNLCDKSKDDQILGVCKPVVTTMDRPVSARVRD